MEKKRKFKLFNMDRDGKGVDPGEDRTPNLKFFFKQLWRKMFRLVTLSMMMTVQVLPLIIAAVVYFSGPQTPTQYYSGYSLLYGIQTASPSPLTSTLLSSQLIQFGLPTFNTYVYWVMIPLIIFTVVTYGWQNVGATYVLRAFVRGDGVFIWSDYFYAIKKNFKQGFLLGLCDCVIMFLLGFDLLYFFGSPATMFNNIMLGIIIAISIMYLFARMYTYLQLITFKISIFKLFKNALIFMMLGIKRNIMAALGCVVLVAVTLLLILLLLPVGFYAILVLPVLYLMGFIGFMCAFAAYPVIEKYMIKPQQIQKN